MKEPVDGWVDGWWRMTQIDEGMNGQTNRLMDVCTLKSLMSEISMWQDPVGIPRLKSDAVCTPVMYRASQCAVILVESPEKPILRDDWKTRTTEHWRPVEACCHTNILMLFVWLTCSLCCMLDIFEVYFLCCILACSLFVCFIFCMYVLCRISRS